MAFSAASRTLHRGLFRHARLVRALFEWEAELYARKIAGERLDRPVFISGLARAGTSALLEWLYASGVFRSLTYADMPFVLSPNLWRRLAGRGRGRDRQLQERAHGDGLQIGIHSPEAFEEVFWKHFSGGSEAYGDHLRPYDPGPEALERFKVYLAMVLASRDAPDRTRYLSKNNNNILRLDSLTGLLPEGIFLVPFRSPVEQASSLLRQHRRFLDIHRADPFARDYMAWLGHHEFGLTHRPFSFPDQEVDLSGYDPLHIDYWVGVWLNYYTYALQRYRGRVHFLSFARWCSAPREAQGALSELVHLKPASAGEGFSPRSRIEEGVDSRLKRRGLELYQALDAESVF